MDTSKRKAKIPSEIQYLIRVITAVSFLTSQALQPHRRHYLLKLAYEVIATSLSYLVVNSLKRRTLRPLDAHANLNPFGFASNGSAKIPS